MSRSDERDGGPIAGPPSKPAPLPPTADRVLRILKQGFAELDQPAPQPTLDQLVRLVLLLAEWAGKINLTGHRTPEAIAERLVLDAIALAKVLPELAGARSLADLGTGAGFPGLPLAILHPHLEVRLVEARQKRNHFQRAARRALDLDHVRPILGRSDRVQALASEVVIAQAMAQPDRAIELMAQWAAPRALLALPASDAGAAPRPPSGFSAARLRSYEVPLTGVRRRLWVLTRDPGGSDEP